MGHDDVREVVPLPRPPHARIAIPGSKSLTNRALLCAGLASGRSTIAGVLDADDSRAMAAAVAALGAGVRWDGDRVEVDGAGGRLTESATLDVRQSGTTARFVTPVLLAGTGTYVVDGDPQLRRRPMGDLLDALGRLGATVDSDGGHLPARVTPPAVPGTEVRVRGDASSQFLSGLLLAGPLLGAGLTVALDGPLVNAPFVEMTVDVMEHYGATVVRPGAGTFTVRPGGYRAADFTVEPDATSASYFLAAAAVAGGTVEIPGLGHHTSQGDLALVDLLARMGAEVERHDDRIVVHGTGHLRGLGAVHLGDVADIAPTLAVVAARADGETELDGIGFVRGHESDRIAALVTELRRCGVDAEERPDGLVVRGGGAHGAVVDSYGDHRIAMAFAVLGLVVDGISIRDPGCVAKTFPEFWDRLDLLRT